MFLLNGDIFYYYDLKLKKKKKRKVQKYGLKHASTKLMA